MAAVGVDAIAQVGSGGRYERVPMVYQTFALKYRPRDFDEIVAQDHVAVTLKNAVAEGRVAHGYLFAGPRGTGKTSTARVLAKALNCEQGPTPQPCGVCHMCTAIGAGRAMDVIERDAASERGINEMRALLEKVPFAPAEGRCKVYILDEAHMLTPEASNALLKTLEEPPAHCYFVLATTEPHKILPTIKSRCQVFEFRPIPLRRIMDSLAAIAAREGIQVEEAALAAIAQAAGGSMRDAQSIFDQVVAYFPGPLSLEVVNPVLGVTEAAILRSVMQAVAEGDIAASFAVVDEVVAAGKDIPQLVADLALYCRDLLRLALGAQPPTWSQTPDSQREGMQELAARLGVDRLTAMIRRLGETAETLRESSQHVLLLELTLAELATLTGAPGEGPTVAAAEGSGLPSEPEQAPVQASEQTRAQAPAQAPAQQCEPQPAEPVGRPTAASPPLPPGTELTLELVREHWGAVLEALRANDHVSVAAMIMEATPTDLSGDSLTLAFPADRQFLRDQTERRYMPIICKALEQVFSRPLGLVLKLGKELETPATVGCGPDVVEQFEPVSEQVPTAQQQEQMVQRALEIFPGSTEITD